MHPAVESVTQLITPPSTPLLRDWRPVERQLTTELPGDYKQLVHIYGGGVFNETIWLLDPYCPVEDYNLLSLTARRAEVLAGLWEVGEPVPVELAQKGARLIPWAYVEGSGAYLYWLAKPGQIPNDWSTMLNEGRGPEWEHHPHSCAEFLISAMTGALRSHCLPGLGGDRGRFDSNADILQLW
ncbi:SMI1/KNR4 family protein [Streptomyces sp. NPDC021098]|uniref:SMI1/KNR4 family protein n=1 Tax=unclassified Streptomyces TaxID=2593676 RepID=UPI0037B69A7D